MFLQQGQPIMVEVVQQPVESTTVADVLLGAIGLTGVLVLAAVLLGALLGGMLIAYKTWRGGQDSADTETIHIV